jgi:Ser/Thr protein kinase RdoA (MazF antagonist)
MPAAENARHPYVELTPDRVLDALDSVGLRGDGRLQALGSYENRVYLVGIEDADAVVAKFYRPGRWTDAAIAEEQGFVAEFGRARIPSWRR